MTALARQDTREVARPLRVLEKLIHEDIEAGEKAGMDYFLSAGVKLNEARDGHYEKDAAGFWEWAERFKRGKRQLQVWMALGSHKTPKRFKSLEEVEEKVLGYQSRGFTRPRREYVAVIDEIAERARAEQRRLYEQEELTRKQEREAEEKLGLRLIDIGYRVLAKELHPDKGGSNEAMARLRRVRDRLRSNV